MIKENLEKILRSLDSHRKTTTILPAVKGRAASDFNILRELGLTTIGENRVQEFLKHYAEHPGFKWHFIGQLQTNKVKYIIGKCELIHSLDRLSLAAEIDRLSSARGKITDCLIELNITAEPHKGGIPLDKSNIFESGKFKIADFLNQLSAFKNIRICGLMTVMPNVNETLLNLYYVALNQLFTHFKQTNSNFNILSAGMSDDYRIAVKHGSTLLRLGRALFNKAVD